ncbi:hypothetical protein D9M73_235200 [compost metagenome]
MRHGRLELLTAHQATTQGLTQRLQLSRSGRLHPRRQGLVTDPILIRLLQRKRVSDRLLQFLFKGHGSHLRDSGGASLECGGHGFRSDI